MHRFQFTNWQRVTIALWYVDEEKQVAQMAYWPPGAPYAYGATLTMDQSRQDKSGQSGTFWWWNGDLDNPTCRPSFGVPSTPPYAWHGFLTDGVWRGV